MMKTLSCNIKCVRLHRTKGFSESYVITLKAISLDIGVLPKSLVKKLITEDHCYEFAPGYHQDDIFQSSR